jgi:tripartite-type tricarboxylate transporter receptor subunit TctC
MKNLGWVEAAWSIPIGFADLVADGYRHARPILLAVSVFAAFAAFAACAAADVYPQRPVRLLIPQSPGGASDTVGRTVAQKLADHFGQQFVVDNRPGATGNIGHEIVAHAAPDGYTMLLTAPNLVTSVSLYAKVPFDPVRDFVPISQLTLSPNVWIVHPSFPAKSMQDLIDVARAKPGAVDFASSGTASTQHLAGELLNLSASVKLVHIPYKGGGPALIDLIGGRVQVMSSTLPSAVPHIKSGRVRALAVTSLARSSALPEVPTVAESAGLRGYEAITWQGLVFPRATPRATVDRMHRGVVTVLAQNDVVARLRDLGYEPVGSSPREFAAYIKAEIAKWAKVIEAGRIKAE